MASRINLQTHPDGNLRPTHQAHQVISYKQIFPNQIKRHFFNTTPIIAGVPQGLSPHLFSIYINNIPQDPEPKIALYADDTTVLGHISNAAIRRLQKQQIDSIEPWFQRWKISLNPTKTTAMMFTHHPSRVT